VKRLFGVLGVTIWTFLSAMLLFGINGSAYIDPSVMTYLIQAIAGIVIAAGVAIGIYFHRAKKKLNEKLNIDENRNKEVESDEIIFIKKDEEQEEQE